MLTCRQASDVQVVVVISAAVLPELCVLAVLHPARHPLVVVVIVRLFTQHSLGLVHVLGGVGACRVFRRRPTC